ncbi:glutathione synthetase-like [Mizuhopecten yessoensis]|uniref:glutathione synthetase-like n=1 Tax=Mizuhopecten yessoensis TaxID=6573 RepID=UPI000B4593B0|nr:glutathione synthetase-like [Mizuhopecten yessoensis]
MATVLDSISLDERKIQEIIKKTKEYAMLHGVLIRTAESPGHSERAHYAPLTLFPMLVPRDALTKVKAIQPHFNKLMHMVAQDMEFLQKCLCNVLKVDDFNKRLWDILQVVTEEGATQPISLGLFRNDYMMDVKQETPVDSLTYVDPTASATVPDSLQMKQIEFNTIASGAAGLVSHMHNVHRYSLTLAGKQFDDSQVPDNNPAHGLAQGLVEGWKAYGIKRTCVLFLVSEPERNRLDQRRLDLEMFMIDRSVPVKYVTFDEMNERGYVRKSDKALIIDDCEVAVVYFRIGYSPANYKSEKDWDTRLMMERSKAIKCPTIQYHLAGTKKIQQELCRPGAVERFIKDDRIARDIRETFVNQYSIDLGEDGDGAIEKAFADPQRYVLKTNREGGGNNVYGEDIKCLLSKMKNLEERARYILMERILPWPQTSYLLKAGSEASLQTVVTEIGIFGVYMGTADKEIYNSVTGHVLRTKNVNSDEGGLMVGLSYMDTPFLID